MGSRGEGAASPARWVLLLEALGASAKVAVTTPCAPERTLAEPGAQTRSHSRFLTAGRTGYRKAVCVCSSRVRLFATPWTDCSPPGSSVHGILQARVRGVRVPFPPPGVLPDSGIEPASPAWAGGFFTTEPPGKPCGKVVRKQKGALPEVSVTLNSR